MTVKEVLRAALESFGPNGENWGKGADEFGIGIFRVPVGKTCALFAIHREAKYADAATRHKAYEILRSVVPEDGYNPVQYNDSPSTTFLDIKSLFVRAIENCTKNELSERNS